MWNDLTVYLRSLVVLAKREEGQAMVEYGLILSLVSIAAVGALLLIGTKIDTVFNEIVEKL